jgi:shikimate dehydrogenase
LRLTATTSLAGVIGSPIRHSRSPAIFNAAFEAAGLDWAYLAFEVPPGGAVDALAAMRAFRLRGLSVTMPHKDAVAGAVDELSDAARALGAVNCVVPRDGLLVGESTDGAGFIEALADDPGFDPAGRTCCVLGAGGAARAVIYALSRAGASEVVVVNRTADRAVTAAALAGPRGRAGAPDDVAGADFVVNATSVGMGDDSALPVDTALLRPGQVVVDLVYDPLETPLLAAARAAGATAVDGLGMLVHQAALAFTLWTGEQAPLDAMHAAARKR